MPIPGDSLGREWLELAGANPHLVNQFRPVLVSFAAAGRDIEPDLVGTGFCIGAGEHMGMFLTAKHVLQKGVLDIQRPHRTHAASALEQFLPPSTTRPKVGGSNLFAIWADGEYAQAMNVVSVSYNDTTDLACCLLVRYGNTTTPFSPPSIPLSTQVPEIGDVVHLVSHEGMRRLPLATIQQDSTPRFGFYRAVSVRMGVVTGVHPDGFRQYKWPCFTTSIPAEPGMSGGFVHVPKHDETVAACGVVCADNSSTESRANQMIAGESVIGLGYMALALTMPTEMRDDAPHRTIQEMMRVGDLTAADGGFEKFNFQLD